MIAYVKTAAPRTSEIRALTGVRGIAACWVMIGHYRAHHVPTPGLMNRIIDHKGLAVDLFLLLSGFVLAKAYGQSEGRGRDWIGFGVFVRNRLARIFPLYLLTTLLCFLLIRIGQLSFGGASASLLDLTQNVLMVQSWGLFSGESLNSPGWSVSTEWAANLLFPIFAFFILTGNRRVAALTTAVAASALAYTAFDVGGIFQGQVLRCSLQAIPTTTVFALVRCVAEFAIGMALWRISLNRLVIAWLSRDLAVAICSTLIICLLPFPRSDLLIVLLFSLLLLGLIGDNFVARLLSSFIPYWLGVISFSIYLMHVPAEPITGVVLDFMTRRHFPAPAVTHTFAEYAIPLLLSLATYNLIENPCKKAFSKKHVQKDGTTGKINLPKMV